MARNQFKIGGVVSSGWRVANRVDYETLRSYAGGILVAGGKLKEAGLAHWLTPNTGADNGTGFTALPSGYRYITGGFFVINERCNLWTPIEWNATAGYGEVLYYNGAPFEEYAYEKRHGFSIRMVRDL